MMVSAVAAMQRRYRELSMPVVIMAGFRSVDGKLRNEIDYPKRRSRLNLRPAMRGMARSWTALAP
jgi:hypothetical protein